jgi:hypothetical protein
MDDSDLLARIRAMVDAEHELRRQMQDDPGEVDDAAQRLRDLEESLDQCWDLLRQRRAHREFAQNPDESQPRPRQQVERYLQ